MSLISKRETQLPRGLHLTAEEYGAPPYGDHPELWSRQHGTTGFNAQLLSLLEGTALYISDPLPGKTHDAKAFTDTPVADIVAHSGGAIGDKGYQGHVDATPRKKPPGGQLSKSDHESNAEISALRAPIERVIAHFKVSIQPSL